MKVSTVEQMRELDRRAIETCAIPGQLLMENAGLASYEVLRREHGVVGHRCAVFCGPGNNGGDGLVVARKLRSSGCSVRALLLGDRAKYRGDALLNLRAAEACGVPLVDQLSGADWDEALAWADVVVDALLGTGIQRDVGGKYAEVIEAINNGGKPVFAIDIPSGIDGNTGAVRGVAVRADHTISFGLPKRGNLLHPGAAHGGSLHVCHISFPPALQQDEGITVATSAPAPLPPRRPDGHKGTFGDVLFIAGAASYYGAPGFAALALLKAGGGYARLAAPRAATEVVARSAPEVVFVPQPETSAGSVAAAAEASLLELAQAVDMVVLGPGLSLVEETQELARRLAARIDRPLLIDGDGLTAVAADPQLLRARRQPTVLTPHPGEMARLRGSSRAEVLADPIAAVQQAATDLGAIVALKTARTLVGLPDGQVRVNLSGNSGMGSAGSGDVLTGTIAAMHGLGLPLADAVCTGVFLHGFAGDLAAADKGEDGITARDILEQLPQATRRYRADHAEITRDDYGKIEVVL